MEAWAVIGVGVALAASILPALAGIRADLGRLRRDLADLRDPKVLAARRRGMFGQVCDLEPVALIRWLMEYIEYADPVNHRERAILTEVRHWLREVELVNESAARQAADVIRNATRS